MNKIFKNFLLDDFVDFFSKNKFPRFYSIFSHVLTHTHIHLVYDYICNIFFFDTGHVDK